MPLSSSGDIRAELPRMALVRQHIDVPRLMDVSKTTKRQLRGLGLAKYIQPGARIAITAGSRGIADIVTVLAVIVQQLKTLGAKPFLVPAMGCHAGATAEAQVRVLNTLGITHEAIGAPILASMEVVRIGTSEMGTPVYCDRLAYESDGIVVVNRIKSHTEFVGDLESGLMKMMVIGLGKYLGAESAHRATIDFGYTRVIPAYGRVFLANAPVLCGVGIVENAYHQVAKVVAIPASDIETAERELLMEAKRLEPTLPFAEVDLLIVDEIGKEISGTGMHTKTIGRIMFVGEPEPTHPKITRIFVRDLAPDSLGNAIGVGLADFITRKLADKIDFHSTYLNAITAMTPEKARLPIICDSDLQAMKYAISTIRLVETGATRVVWIQNTLELERMLISESLLAEATGRLELLQQPRRFVFDSEANLVTSWQE